MPARSDRTYQRSAAQLVAFALFGLAACEEKQPLQTPAPQLPRSAAKIVSADEPSCYLDEPARSPAEQAKVETALLERLREGNADPLADAAHAAAKGDFRLVWGVDPFEGPQPLGLVCRAPHSRTNMPGLSLNLAIAYFSDVIQADNKPTGWQKTELLAPYGRAFNVALASAPNYPYADICTREPAGSTPTQLFSFERPQEFVPRSKPWIDRPRSLHEAARRGSPEAFRRALARASLADIDRPDGWGLTPLAWAVLAGRTDTAAALVQRGADPLGEDCDVDLEAAPLRLAYELDRKEMIDILMTEAAVDRLGDRLPGLSRRTPAAALVRSEQ